MYVATLICNPSERKLRADVVDSVLSRLNGSRIDWLAEDEAADIYLDAKSDVFDVIHGGLQRMGIDLVVQLARTRRKRVLLADMDSTMIQQECIDELADEAGVGARVAEITARAMNGELDFEDALRERVGLLAGLPVSVIDDVLKKRITLMPGGAELLATMKADGAYCALVSGGFTDFTAAIAAKLGFDENHANTLLQEDGKLTGKTGIPILGQQAKVEALNNIVTRLALAPEDVIAVGDGANDLGMLTRAGSGVALHAKPIVAEQAELQLNCADLTGLLFIQGYKRSEFIAA